MSQDGAYKILLIADSTIDPLARFVSRDRPDLSVDIAAYDQVAACLRGDLAGHDLAVVFARLERVSAQFVRALQYESYDRETLFAEVDSFAALLRSASAKVPALIMFTWVPPFWLLPAGLHDFKPPYDLPRIVAECNLKLATAVEDCTNVYLLDSAQTLAGVGSDFDPKLWALGKIVYSRAGLEAIGRRIRAASDALRGTSRKLIVVDLDNTLWGGIVGDDGWQNLKLGGIDPIGESYSIFQKQLKALRSRGILLAIVSRNEEATAIEAIRRHPEMVLSADDFAGWRINWRDKAQNIAELAAELNLGFQSIVFIDDNPAERDRVRQALPEVLVPEWPADPAMYPQALRTLDCFGTVTFSQEDRARTQMYQQERRRAQALGAVQSREDWLASLEMKVKVEPLNAANLPRAVQLLNKTNQFNLATRRMTQAQYQAWACQPGNRVLTFEAEDRFGTYGLIGLLGMTADGQVLRVVDWVLSCRAMGRGIEETMAAAAGRAAVEAGCRRIIARYLATAKNKPILDFLCASRAVRHGDEFHFSIVECNVPAHVRVQGAGWKEMTADVARTAD